MRHGFDVMNIEEKNIQASPQEHTTLVKWHVISTVFVSWDHPRFGGKRLSLDVSQGVIEHRVYFTPLSGKHCMAWLWLMLWYIPKCSLLENHPWGHRDHAARRPQFLARPASGVTFNLSDRIRGRWLATAASTSGRWLVGTSMARYGPSARCCLSSRNLGCPWYKLSFSSKTVFCAQKQAEGDLRLFQSHKAPSQVWES